MVEVVIAIAILAGGLIGAVRVFPVGLRASQRSEWMSRATLEGERTLEPLKLNTWEELVMGQTTTVTDGPFQMATTVDQPAVAGLLDPARLKRLSVTVSWTQEGRARSLTMVSYVCRPTT